MAGVTPVHLNSYFNYMAKKIRIPLTNKVTLFAEYGSIYRIMEPSNLRYQCKSNVYINNMLPRKDCYKKSYLPGGYVAPYFAVGYETTGNDGTKYAARYIYTPGEENANRLVWRDASVTHIYAISASTHKPKAEIIKHLNGALDVIRTHPALDRVLGKHFFAITLNKLSS